jgi:hypothetical protein
MSFRPLTFLLLAGFAASATAGSWTRVDDVGSDPVSKTTREQFTLGATGRVDVRSIGGNVEIKAGGGDRAELVYEKKAASQKDFDCETLQHELKDGELRVWVERVKERGCRTIRAEDKLSLTVPRGASVSVRGVGDEVTVDGVEGRIKLAGIGDSVTVTGARELEASGIGDTVKADIAQLGAGGIRISGIGDRVELSLPEKVDARLRIANVGDEIRGPGLRLDSDDEDEDDGYEAELGKGGALIRIENIGDTVEIRGPQLGRSQSL